MQAEEREAVTEVLGAVLRFAGEADRGASVEKLLRSKHAETIAPLAGKALALLNERGRFDEDAEEDEPSGGPQPI